MSVFAEFFVTIILALFAGALTAVLSPRMKRRVARSRGAADGLVVFFALTYVLVFGALALLRHASFHSGGFDLGIFDQVVWNSLHGNLFERSIVIESPISLGQHFSPTLLALVPVYAVWSDVRALLILQTLALALAGIPIYWYARRAIGNAPALALAAAFYLSPSLQSINLFEFHEIALVLPLLTLATFFLLRGRMVPCLVCLAVALLTKEEIGFIVFTIGAFVLWRRQKTWLGAAMMVGGIAWVALALLVVIPFFRDPLHGTDYQYVDRYLYLGRTVPEIIRTLVTQPGLVWQHFWVPPKIEFILHLLVPLVFLPLLGFEILALALPSFGYILLGDNAFQNSIRFQYTAPLLPFVFFGAVEGLQRLAGLGARGRGAWLSVPITVTLFVAGAANYLFQSAGPLGLRYDATQYAITDHVRLGYELLSQIPPGASVMADSNLTPHLSQRRYVYQASVVPDLRRIDYLLADQTLPIHAESEMIWRDILPSPMFVTLAERDGYILKKRADPRVARSAATQFGGRITLLGFTPEYAEPARRGETIAFVLLWRADAAIRERYVIFAHLIDARDRIGAQGDREPGNGWFRTDRWNTGDLTLDRYWLDLPAEMPTGENAIAIGVYDSITGARLVTETNQDRVILIPVQVR